MTDQVPQHIDKEKIFIVNRSEIEGRLDPEFYRPSIATLEKHIRSLATHKLKDYILYMAGGATPKKTEADKYYSDSVSGIPFLRVQNLQTNGELSLDDCVYINKDTHNGLLQRSQVTEGDLLVKITGVGRMAIASVAPKGFVGNTNQHMVVIKTGDADISKYLARYLNLDIIERIASRHSTGGTRPALDYPSLKNIPIIEGIDFSIIDEAISIKQQKEQQAEDILNSIDDYLLGVLGIILPETNTQILKDRFFTSNFSDIKGRLDPFYYQPQYKVIDEIIDKSLNKCTLGDVIFSLNNGIEVRNYVESGYRYLRVTDMGKHELNDSSVKYINITEIPNRIKLNENCILVSRSGSLGLISEVNKSMLDFVLSSHIFKVELNSQLIHPKYAVEILRSRICQNQIFRNNNGGIIPEIQQNALKSIKIPLPSLEKQQEIVDYIANIRNQAKTLQKEGKNLLEQAKQKVEQMIIGQ